MGLHKGVPAGLGRVGLKPTLCHCGKAMVKRLSLASRGRSYLAFHCKACSCDYDSRARLIHKGGRCRGHLPGS